MRVVLDTNVIVAAFAVRGLCKDVFEYCLQETDIISSHSLLDEIQRILSKKIKLPKSEIESVLAFLREQSTIVAADGMPSLSSNLCRDPDDLAVLATAKGGQAQTIVTGDEDLLILREFEGIRILSPREFWNLLCRPAK